jgi:hypothetical protein
MEHISVEFEISQYSFGRRVVAAQTSYRNPLVWNKPFFEGEAELQMCQTLLLFAQQTFTGRRTAVERT